MDEAETLPPEDGPAPERRHPGRTIAKWTAIVIGGLAALVGLLLLGVNTDPGRRFIVDRINALELASGLDIDIGRIDGSIYGSMVIRDLRLSDQRGQFFAAPRVELDWRPFAYINNHVNVRSLVVPSAQLARLPELIPSEADPNAPLLPDLDIDVGRLEVGRLAIGPAVTGQRHLVSLNGGVHIADGRAQLNANARTIAAQGLAGGDRLTLRLDAVPDENRFDVDARLQAPRGGLVTSMAGLDAPLAATIGGEGSWSAWQGAVRATLGGQALANFDVRGRDGNFHITGPLRPNLLLDDGSAARIVSPVVQTDIRLGLLESRRLDLRAQLRSQALAIAAQGRLDLGNSRFGGTRVEARLLQPGAILPNLSGRDVRVSLLLDGPFATPFVSYDVQAAALGFNETVLEGLRASGRAKVDADRITVPVQGRITRITGLNPAVGGLLTNVTIAGSFAIDGPNILSDNIRIRSDRLNATTVIVADLAEGTYRAGLQGRVDNYLVRGVGLLDINSDVDLVSVGDGFGLQGRVAFRTRRIDNASARDFLGGNAVGSARFGFTPEGVITIRDVRMTAPQFRITSGGGSYRPDGRIDIRAEAVSTAYGPLSVVVGGTIEQPQVLLRAQNPGFGIGLRGVEARVRGTGRGYAILATGESDYGPFSADVLVLTGGGPLTVEVNRVTFAGIDFRGRIVQSPAGPFVGTLSFAGSGLNGSVRLAAAGQYQQAFVTARANGATIPGATPILIQRAIIDAQATLYPNGPAVTGDVQIAGLRRGDLLVRTARARANYRDGSGTAQIVAEGSSGVPFRIASNVRLAPNRILAALQGSVNRIDFRLAQPAVITNANGTWRLAPATLVLPQGNVRLAGSYGDGITLQSRFRDFDLSIINAFSPGIGIGGRATGSLDFAQPNSGTFPRADARVTIDRFTRSGVATVSTPVNIAMVGQLRPEGGRASAVIRRGGAIVGRMQANLSPLGPGAGSWTERLLAAPLGGGIRYNGPAEVLWSLSGIADQQLSGPIGIAVDFGGRVQNPNFRGIVRANALRFEDETYGTRITNLALQGQFTRSRLEITQLQGRAGDGTISGSGSVGLAADAGFPVDFRLALRNAQLARSDAVGARVSGDIRVTNGPNQPALIQGELNLPEVRYQIIRQGAAELIELDGVRRKGQPLPEPDANRGSGVPSIWNLDLRIRADNRLFVSGMGLESEWSADLRVGGTSGTPEVTGEVSLIRGTFGFAGTSFELTSGEIEFTGSRPIEPLVNIAATATVDDVDINLSVTGTAFDPQIAFTSSPALPQDEIMARLLFGGSVNELSALQLVQLGASLNSLRGGGGGLNPLGKLRSAGGLSRLRVLGADEATGRGTALSAGFYLGDDVYVEVITDTRGFTATQLEIALSRTLSLLSQAGSFGGSNAQIRYRKQY